MALDLEQLKELRGEFEEGYWRQKNLDRLNGINPLENAPSWLDDELREVLHAIPEPHSRKKRTTVLRIAEARAAGLDVIAEIFKSPDCCSGPVWYGRRDIKGKLMIGWKNHPEIMAALDVATRKAHEYYDAEEARQMEQRRRKLNFTLMKLAEVAIASPDVFLEIMTDAGVSPDVRRKAAVDVLDHAGVETAQKSQAGPGAQVNIAVAGGPSMADIANRRRDLGDREVGVVEGETTSEGPPPPGTMELPIKHMYEEPPMLSDDGGNGHHDEEVEAEVEPDETE